MRDVPLPASWNEEGVTTGEVLLLAMALVPEKTIVRRQRRRALWGAWLSLGGLGVSLLVGPYRLVGLAAAVLGVALLATAWEMRHARTTRRVLRRLCGEDPN
ncbi:MAG: hypothetical protein ACYDBQ_11845 [Thermoplasmatota archaeon]